MKLSTAIALALIIFSMCSIGGSVTPRRPPPPPLPQPYNYIQMVTKWLPTYCLSSNKATLRKRLGFYTHDLWPTDRKGNTLTKCGEAMDALDSVIDPLRDFAKDSTRLLTRCHKPDQIHEGRVAFRVAIGFVVVGFVGFFVKLIFIPINNIIVGSA